MKVLLVDDTAFNRTLPRVLLQRYGCSVAECDNGADALLMASSGEFDCVLLDIMMPSMSGTEVCQRLRSDPTLSGLRIIAYTAHALPAEIQEIMAAGFDDILVKPIDIKTLLAKVGIDPD
ncbi:response regulator [Pseudomonas sp. MAP12]|uniref:Response regulator n=1 Tax=Geopseudomonas aromaticivorans TaxID=2849492 RepID=A0ABS6N384_9GAMM|nr:response regulator [Pseudomonas aromaticivorans]MBV2135139.1 response regulator [Pseudomonas aromaticivorans]